jgi:hypothetical protein
VVNIRPAIPTRLIESTEKEAEAFFTEENKAAGMRLRNALQH